MLPLIVAHGQMDRSDAESPELILSGIGWQRTE
jgi:hypothetical protein